jgi:hypothetical protein
MYNPMFDLGYLRHFGDVLGKSAPDNGRNIAIGERS